MKPFFETDMGRLYHGDCRDVLQEIPDQAIDLIVTDPPFKLKTRGTGYFGIKRKYQLKKLTKIGTCETFSILSFLEIFKKKMKIFNGYFWTSKGLLPEYFQFITENNYFFNLLFWDKLNAPAMVSNNFIPELEYLIHIREKGATFNKGLPIEYYKKSFKSAAVKGKHGHPTEKPFRAFYPYIEISSNPGDLILDPFLGSGTFAIICEGLKKRWIGIEILKEFCDIAKTRIKEEVYQPLFENQGRLL